MNVWQRIPRDRRTPGRACGHVAFVLKWSSGEVHGRAGYSKTLNPIIRMFLSELRRVPPEEFPTAVAPFTVATRKARGGAAWIQLVAWSGLEPVEKFFQDARDAWKKLPKEDDDYRSEVVDDKRFDQ